MILAACSAVLIETDPRIPTHTLYWVVPVQLLCGGVINLSYDVAVRRRLRAKRAAALQELDREQLRLHHLRSQLCAACGEAAVAVFMEGGAPPPPEMAPPPLLQQLTSCSSLVERQLGAVRALDDSIEETLVPAGPFHLSPRFTVPAFLALAGLFIACTYLHAARPDLLERHAMLRLFTAFFLHGLRVNGGPPVRANEPICMIPCARSVL